MLTVDEFYGECQFRSQSPRYPYPAAGIGNKDQWDKAFRHDRILGLPVLLRIYSAPCFKGKHPDSNKIIGLPVLLRMSGGTLYPSGPCCPFLPLNKGNEDSGNEIG